MTLYEFNAALMWYSRIQSGKAEPMTDGDFEDSLAALRALNLPDVKV